MSIEVSLSVARDVLKSLRPEKITPPIKRALRKAGSTALRDMRSEASKRVRQRKRIKARTIARALRMRRTGGSTIGSMEWALDVSGAPMRVADYPHRQTRKGVSVEINRGKRSLIRSAFVASMKSGHKGVFLRRGQRRLPIDEQMASRVSDALLHAGEVEAIHRRGRESFAATYRRVLPMELEKDKTK